MRTLRVTSGPAAGQSVEIERELVIGREGADLTIDDPELSRRHVALRAVEDGVEVEDLGSLNGTFVAGQRISSPTTLTSRAQLRVGTTEAMIEVSLPQTTRVADTPQAAPPGATVARPVQGPEVTVQRHTVEPEVTAQRPVPPPDAPAQDPDVTVQRPVGGQGPDVTVQRPVGAGPPATPPPDGAREGGGGERGRPPVALIAAGLALLVLIVLAVVLLSGGDSGASERRIDYRHELTAPTAADKRRAEATPGRRPIRWTLTGRSRGTPFGAGNTITRVTLQPVGPPPGAPKPRTPPADGRPKAATVTVRFEIRLANGTLVAAERLASRRAAGGVRFTGTGRVISGTGEFADAKGSFRVTGGRPKFDESFETARWVGTVEY